MPPAARIVSRPSASSEGGWISRARAASVGSAANAAEETLWSRNVPRTGTRIAYVGEMLGDKLGDWLGESDGDRDGLSDGDKLGDKLGL